MPDFTQVSSSSLIHLINMFILMSKYCGHVHWTLACHTRNIHFNSMTRSCYCGSFRTEKSSDRTHLTYIVSRNPLFFGYAHPLLNILRERPIAKEVLYTLKQAWTRLRFDFLRQGPFPFLSLIHLLLLMHQA